MNVPEVTTLYECLRTVIKHFECSIKNKELLDEAMEILELTPLHLLSWCQTRMGHFLKACKVFNEMLPAVYDTMYTKGIRIDERDLLFTASNIFILKLLAEIQPEFDKGYLRKADKSSLLVSTVYNTARSFVDRVNELQTPNANEFKDSLRIDQNGNVLVDTKVMGNNHTMMLNHPHKPSRHTTEAERLQKIKDSMVNLKERIVENIVSNVEDQCGENTFYYSWSGLDLEVPISIDSRIERLKDLITLFCTEKIHTVSRYNNAAETIIIPDTWEGYEVCFFIREFFLDFNNVFVTLSGLEKKYLVIIFK